MTSIYKYKSFKSLIQIPGFRPVYYSFVKLPHKTKCNSTSADEVQPATQEISAEMKKAMPKNLSTDLQTLWCILYKRAIKQDLTDIEFTILKQANHSHLIELLTTYKSSFPSVVADYVQKGDILQVVFIYQHENVEKELKLLYIVDSKTFSLGEEAICDFFVETLWKKRLANLTTGDVLLSAIQIKRMFPTHRACGVFTKSYVYAGNLDPNQHTVAAQDFALKMGSSFLKGGRDDHSLKLPFVSTDLKALNKSKADPLKGALTELLTFLTNPIIIKSETTDKVILENKFYLIIQTNRRDAIGTYLPVNDMVPLGFILKNKTNGSNKTIYGQSENSERPFH
jgi:hypothetical protein